MTGRGEGTPDALQVADRFQLIRNLGEALERCFNRQRRFLQQVPRPSRPAAGPAQPRAPVVAAPRRPSLEVAKEQTRAERLARYQLIRERYLKGASISELARELKLNWQTIRSSPRPTCVPNAGPIRSGRAC